MPEVEQKMVVELREIDSAARQMWHLSGGCKLWLFQGDLGAGKTTLIKAIGHYLGVTSPMASPTFSIVNEYNSTKAGTLYHFDFYRLKNESEALDIGVDEYFDSGHYCFIEWPDRVASLLPARYFEIRISHQSEFTRLIEYKVHE